MKHITLYRLISVMLIVLVVAAAIGCGKKEAEKATPTPTAIPTPTATPSEPSGQTGSLSGLTGDVQVLRSWSSSWIAATSGMKIGTGDSLKTGSDGYVLITFFDGSVMEVQADSQISVEELSKASGGSTTVRISQTLGNTINRVENLIDSSSTYEVETLAGSAVVRGTIYHIQVDEDGRHTCCDTQDEKDTEDHYVYFSNLGKTVQVPEKKKSCGWEGGVPSDPFFTDPNDDPLKNTTGDSGGGSPCPPGCYFIQGEFIQGEGAGLFGAYIIEDGFEGCICPCGEELSCFYPPEICCQSGEYYYCAESCQGSPTPTPFPTPTPVPTPTPIPTDTPAP